ncbi:hypothetical protein J0X15_16330 [Roseibium sp. CAU 1637]|uniref:Uncharacterized protein n=1 Tax=Roseibium limicola TaxID=2816037 RepID=A0A939EPY9_9HYPH|nr:hypothetical protein [Roseibium limicola]MBO0346795.1 hypothetical protein [Roseibium limicola]
MLTLSAALEVPVHAQDVLPGGVRVPIQGYWTSGCIKLGMGGRHGAVVTLHVSPLGVLRAQAQMFAGPSCDRPTVLARYRGEIIGNSALGELDHRVEAVRLSVADRQALALYNEQPDNFGCGFARARPWALNRERDVAGRTCGGQGFARVGTVLKDRYWLEGEELRFGALPLSLEPVARPTQPGPVVFYKVGLVDRSE